ncbi:hypothetical protein BST33_00500 [Mycolicibacter minnesotensis]|uniref:Uncharacterized protein n=1 Tax=Mycolicibacter minnesotensis TaxID=1118379 RepID=A0A7I7R8H5_9MYCO|nr:DUF732 domain-containing protein [Mycolicibacter minnesotensis]ORB04414.1 hypothetical protein BST33_00500 [Mycolicibacter minnesotensis]BBY34998.1 hypothetical protein MMIN_30590 [Mycolicibacter minnesotensis]
MNAEEPTRESASAPARQEFAEQLAWSTDAAVPELVERRPLGRPLRWFLTSVGVVGIAVGAFLAGHAGRPATTLTSVTTVTETATPAPEPAIGGAPLGIDAHYLQLLAQHNITSHNASDTIRGAYQMCADLASGKTPEQVADGLTPPSSGRSGHVATRNDMMGYVMLTTGVYCPQYAQ